MSSRKLDEVLLAEGLVDEQSLSLARTEALARQRSLAEIVIDLGLIDQRSLGVLLARESGVELASPIDTQAAGSLIAMVPAVLARRHQVVPIRHEPDGLVVAMIDPFEPGIVEIIESASGVPVRRAVGIRSEVEMAVLELYHVEDDADRTIQLSGAFALELAAPAVEHDEYSGIPDEWTPSAEDQRQSAGWSAAAHDAHDGSGSSDADRTAPTGTGQPSEADRLAHVERQLLSVSRALALIQSRLDTIDARLANLGSHPREVR